MEILDTNTKYDIFHNIYLTTHEGKIKLTVDEAVDIAYAIVDSFGLNYKILDELENAYAEYKENN